MGISPFVIDKSALLTAVVAKLEADLALQTRAANLARDEATNEESRAESKWDTRGQEAAYLAEGQAKLATELMEAITLFKDLDVSPHPPPATIRPGTVFQLRQPNGSVMHGLIGPRCGGTEVEIASITIVLVTPISPLGREVIGRKAGDTVHLIERRKPRAHKILDTW
ncbi:MAG: GreA/GreB family elongation factor [Synoicihabitans sp.]